jgi:hypothetical protein
MTTSTYKHGYSMHVNIMIARKNAAANESLRSCPLLGYPSLWGYLTGASRSLTGASDYLTGEPEYASRREG